MFAGRKILHIKINFYRIVILVEIVLPQENKNILRWENNYSSLSSQLYALKDLADLLRCLPDHASPLNHYYHSQNKSQNTWFYVELGV